MARLAIWSLFIMAMSWAAALNAATPQLESWSDRASVDTDGDGVPDLFDNAPGVANDQADADGDLIGDVIDPTPLDFSPFLGDLGLGLGGPYLLAPGSDLFLEYLCLLQVPPGAWGRIDLDLGGDGIYDATYFGPLTGDINFIDMPPGRFELPGSFSLTVPGTYLIHAMAYAPGMWSQAETITSVTVVPESPSLLMLAGSMALALIAARRKRGGNPPLTGALAEDSIAKTSADNDE